MSPELGIKKVVMFLTRKMSWMIKGMNYETDSKLVGMIFKESHIDGSQPAGTPMSRPELRRLASMKMKTWTKQQAQNIGVWRRG